MALPDLKAAGRVARTAHQLILTAVVVLPVVATQTDLNAETAGSWAAGLVVVGTAIAKLYNIVFPGQEPLDEF